MDFTKSSRKAIGAVGERIVAEYLRRRGFTIVDRNISRKTGELDIIAKHDDVLHFVEVKTILCQDYPNGTNTDGYDPAMNLHAYKIKKVARTAEWYVQDIRWECEWQVDGALVWLRERDGMALVRYYPQIL